MLICIIIMHTMTQMLVDNVEAWIFPVPIIGIKFNVRLLLFFSEISVSLAHRQSSKAYCLMISLKLEVLHTNQTLYWTWEFFIDFLCSICLSSIWALYTYNCIFTASCWDSGCYEPSFTDVELRHKESKTRNRHWFSKPGLSCILLEFSKYLSLCKKFYL